MSLDSIASAKTNRLTSVPNDLFGEVRGVQRQLYEEFLTLITELSSTNGFIDSTKGNLTKARTVLSKLVKSLKNTEYSKALRKFAKEFDKQAKLTGELFELSIGEFKASPLTDEILAISKSKMINTLVGTSLDIPIFAPILNQLDAAVSSGASLVDTRKQIKLLLEGGTDLAGIEIDGKLLNYNKTIANDSFAIADREYTFNVSNDLGVEWYRYSGGTIADSRKFCIARNGDYFHRKEVESWVTTKSGRGNPNPHGNKWQGRIRGTDKRTIFSFCGGHNCKHSLLPVTAFVVPKSVLKRNVKSKNYKPTEFEIKELKL